MIEHEIIIPIYKIPIIIICGTNEEVITRLKEKHQTVDFSSFYDYDGNYFTVNEEIRYLAIYEKENMSVIYHESMHAAFDIMRLVKIDLCYESEEAFTYLAQYISEQVINIIKAE